MKLSMKQWLMIGVGAFILYMVYQKMQTNSAKTVGDTPAPNPEGDDVEEADVEVASDGGDFTQGDLFEEKFGAFGSKPCFCNGQFMGYVSGKGDCRRMCRKAVKFGTI